MTTTVSASLNVDTIVSAIMKPYQQKLNKLNNDISSYDVKISTVGKLKSSLSDLEDVMKKIEGNEFSPLSTDALKTAIKSFVTDFNGIKGNTKNSSDIELRRFSQNLRSEIDPTVSNSLGLTFDKTGLVKFDEIKFDSLNTSNPSALTTAVNHIFDKTILASSTIDGLTKTGGKLDYTVDLYNQKVNNLTKKQVYMEDQLNKTEASYRRQFQALQNILNKMDANQSVITGFNKNNSN